ncbi:MAG TPA: hypothetical protein VFQ30_02755 [Ktedonobacteraceae bacterium]|nr:hypothetical protein [Ktedonobacteraceae bacterium]
MPGSRGQDNEPNQPYAQRLAPTNGTGKHRVPQRPPRMSRVDLDHPPATPRVARPRREEKRPVNWRRRLLIFGGLFILCGLLACGIGFAAVNLFSASNASAGAATTTADFLQQLKDRNYASAFDDLGANITVQTTQDEFTRTAQRDDTCYGPVTDYTEVPNSATTQNNTQSYSYTVTRSKLSKPYQLKLTLQQDNYGDWKIISYGNDLGPKVPTC